MWLKPNLSLVNIFNSKWVINIENFPFNRPYKHLLIKFGKKEFFKYSVLQGNIWKVLGIYENFSFVEVSYEYVIVSQSKKVYRVDTIASYIFFVGGTQAPFLDTTYYERDL